MTEPVTACLGLGSNLDDPVAQVHRALAALAVLPQSKLIACSSLYRSPPLGPIDQPDYINAVVALATVLSPTMLLAECQRIERQQGRERRERWGPRTLDIDVLLYGSQVLAQDGLCIPHPGLYERNFVLYPLAEIAAVHGLPVVIPGARSLQALLAACPRGALEQLRD